MSRPNEAPDIEAAHGAPDTESIVYQQLDASCAGIAEDIGVVSAGGAEDLDDARQQPVGPGTHVHGLNRQPYGIDADHRSHSRSQVPQASASCTGQSTKTAQAPRRISRRIAEAAAAGRWFSIPSATNPDVARVNGCCVGRAKFGLAPVPRDANQCRTKLGFNPRASATDLIDIPGCWQASTTSALNSGLCLRLERLGRTSASTTTSSSIEIDELDHLPRAKRVQGASARRLRSKAGRTWPTFRTCCDAITRNYRQLRGDRRQGCGGCLASMRRSVFSSHWRSSALTWR